MAVDVDKEKLTGRDLLCEDTLPSLFPGIYDVSAMARIRVDRFVAQKPGTPEEKQVIDFARRYPNAVIASHYRTDTVWMLERMPSALSESEVVGRDVVVADVSQVAYILFVLED
jgi:hypothetical protein